MEIIKALVRPILAVGMPVAWFYLIVKGISVPLAFEVAAAAVPAYYFWKRSQAVSGA